MLQAAGLLFFAFAGYARIATLGEEVRDPERTIPRAIPLALGITVGLYAGGRVALLVALGPGGARGERTAACRAVDAVGAGVGRSRRPGRARRSPASARCSR